MQKRYASKKATPFSMRVMVCIIMLAAFLLPAPWVNAHPHVFIVQRLEMVFDDKGLSGIRIRWLFDELRIERS